MHGLVEAKPVHARWAQANGDFLEFVKQNPEYQSRESFGSLYEVEWLRKLSIQPWPLFVDTEQRRELDAIARGVDGVVRGVIERFLVETDPAEVSAFYAADNSTADQNWETFTPDEDFVAMLTEEPNGILAAPSRGDYIEDREGLKLVEYNAGAFLGGLQIDAIGDLYVASAPTARFLAEQSRRARSPGTLRALYLHVVEDTARLGVWTGGDLNVAMMVLPNEPDQHALHSRELYEREYALALREGRIAPSGHLLLCGPDDLVPEDGYLTVDGRRIHALLEFHDGTADIKLAFRYFKMGRLNLFTGPVSWLLSDKRNLALVSSLADSDELTGPERELVRRHVPWTRRVVPARTTFRGRPFRLPDDLEGRREELVLKKASSIGGRYVHVGKFRTDAEWRDVIARAAREGDWVVQEYLETVPYCFQSGADGVGRHDMVWGLFVFGSRFGGAFLRMQPAGGGSGLVNTHQGAEVGVLLDLVG